MTAKSVWNCPRSRKASDFPVVATIAGVSGCFAEALLKKHFAPGATIELSFALLQAVPLAMVIRYFALRLRRQSSRISIDRGA
ncbi:hypothetical protein BH18VER1_BH18VER1_20830 [soil metagenome]